MARLVLSDATPLIGLSRVDGVGWLRALFGTVEVTAEVWLELEGGGPETTTRAALDAGWLCVRPKTRGESPRPPHLGAGEWSCLLAASNHDGPALLLLDDRLARREARALGVPVAGTAAIIALAQRRGLIDSARDVFERLLRSDFRIAPAVIRQVLAELEQD